jgi:hypothetical protein
MTGARPYASPYVAGVGLGLVLLAAFVIAGRGLGASGAYASAVTAAVSAAAPEHARGSAYFARYLGDGRGPLADWLVVELAGVLAGGWLSALAARRLTRTVERGPRVAPPTRLALGFAGGFVMAAGAVLARGCTSGQALTGGALLSVGSWLFTGGAFAAAYAVAPALRRVWT